MPGRLLLDTSVVVDFFAGDATAARVIDTAEEVFLSSIALGELFYGAYRSSQREANIAQVEAFLTTVTLLACDGETARHYGEIKNALRTVGRPLPENDVWIAATARRHGLTLGTRDAHFREIAGLALLAW
jgi:tRNA(fMet)-specific endonuclease VapC